MHEELEALKAKGVYEEITELPPGRKAVQCKWVLQIKRDQIGQISRFKGCLIAKEFTQIFWARFHIHICTRCLLGVHLLCPMHSDPP